MASHAACPLIWLRATIAAAVKALPPASQAQPATGMRPEGTPVEHVSGLSIPWSAATVGSELLISQRDSAEIVAWRPGTPLRPVGTIPGFVARGDGGMLGVAALRRGAEVWLYAYHSTAEGNRIVRLPYAGGRLGAAQTILDGIPGGRGHNGGRLGFGPDGMLYATVGDTRNGGLSQNLNSLAGKILRMTLEGEVPSDNPIRGSLVFSLGHRNPQGLTWDGNGQLWTTDFGERGWDELNRIVPGGNYGWPHVEGRGDNAAYIDPIIQWRPRDMGPSGLAYVDGTVFIAGLTGERLWSVTVDAAGRANAADYFAGVYGRIRDVFRGSDGDLWLLTNGRRGDPDGLVLSVPLWRAPTPRP